MAYNKSLGYDPDKDYSLALQDSSLTSAQRSQLEAERQAKIDKQYGGVEPTMQGSNKTYTELYGGKKSGNSQYAGTDYHQDAINAAESGDWKSVYEALAARDEKVAATGNNYGKTSSDILDELLAQYGTPQVEQPTFDLSGFTPPQLDLSDLEKPAYEGSKWDSILDALAEQLLNMNYNDWAEGDQYKALAERYGQQGKMGMQDVLGQVSSRTGGMASSYATTAAQQQYNAVMAQLEQAAMEMYGVERGDLLENAQLAQQYADEDYKQYLDALDQYNNDRNFEYNKYLDELGQFNTDRDFAYGVHRDEVEDQQYKDELAYAKEQQEKSDLMDIAETLAAYGDFSGYKALGYTDEQIAALSSGYQAQIAAKKTGSGGGSGGSKMTLSTAKAMMDAGQFTDEAVQTMLDAGFNEEYLRSEYGWEGGESEETGNRTSLDFDEDEGIFTWNGKTYTDVETLLAEIEAAGLTDSELEALKRKFSMFGFNLS